MNRLQHRDRLDLIQQEMAGCGECCDAAAGLWALDVCCAERALPHPTDRPAERVREGETAGKDRGQ